MFKKGTKISPKLKSEGHRESYLSSFDTVYNKKAHIRRLFIIHWYSPGSTSADSQKSH